MALIAVNLYTYMKLKIKFKFKYLSILIGGLIGSAIPMTFIILDLYQLEMNLSFQNAIDIINSQNIYIFSFVLFPALFSIVLYLGVKIIDRNKKIKNQELFTKEILNNFGDSIIVANHSGQILRHNITFQNSFNLKVGDSLSLIFEDKEILKDLLNEKIKFNNKTILITNDKTQKNFLVSVNIFNFYLNSKDSYNFIFCFKNIDELVKNENLLEESRALIEMSSRMSSLGEISAGFAHEINNPLSIIQTNNLLIKKYLKKMDIESIDEKKSQTLDKLIDSTASTILRITKIIKSLRKLARDGTDDDFEEVPILEVLEEVFVLTKVKTHNTGIKLKIIYNGHENEKVSCKQVEFSQIFINLVNNAVDAISNIEMESKWLHIEVEKVDGAFLFKVIDSGSGISEDIAKSIFQPMFTTKDIGLGTGLGLSISKSIAQKHFGDLYVDSSNKNTCFVIKIPCDIANLIDQKAS